MASWTAEQIPNQSGRVAIVTGANTGIGLETARELERRGARVILACRDRGRGEAAAEAIRRDGPCGRAVFMSLDLSRLESVRKFASDFLAKYEKLDLLINNAGVMFPPFSKTEEGFELQIGINFLGHFALTGLLFDRLAGTPGSRVVTVSSVAHRRGQIDFEAFRGEKPYRPWREYAQSKLADLMFAIEMQRRLGKAGMGMISLAAHPGWTKTDLQRHDWITGLVIKIWSMEAPQGALPTLYGATAPEAEGGGYYGPDGFGETRGYPAPSRIMPQALDEKTARRLWEIGEELTGVRFLSAA